MHQDSDLGHFLDLTTRRASALVLEGYAQDDHNIPDNVLIVDLDGNIFSFEKSDILEEEKLGHADATEGDDTSGDKQRLSRRVRMWVRAGATGFRMTHFTAGQPLSSFQVQMENVAPPPPMLMSASAIGAQMAMENQLPPPPPVLGVEPKPAPGVQIEAVEQSVSPETYAPRGTAAAYAAMPTVAPPLSTPLGDVGMSWMNSCAGGDQFPNNCAHFLSDAFIRAGYTELLNYGTRCYTWARRPIRAREMWSWFASKANRTSNVLTPNTGWWAAFQLDERAYWGGHVALLDSDSWRYYGTGWYGSWAQYLYQW